MLIIHITLFLGVYAPALILGVYAPALIFRSLYILGVYAPALIFRSLCSSVALRAYALTR